MCLGIRVLWGLGRTRLNLVKRRSRWDINAPFFKHPFSPSSPSLLFCARLASLLILWSTFSNLSGFNRLPEPTPVAVHKRGRSPPTVPVDRDQNLYRPKSESKRHACDSPPRTPPSLPVTHTSPLRFTFTYGGKHPAIDLQISLTTYGKKIKIRGFFGCESSLLSFFSYAETRYWISAQIFRTLNVFPRYSKYSMSYFAL